MALAHSRDSRPMNSDHEAGGGYTHPEAPTFRPSIQKAGTRAKLTGSRPVETLVPNELLAPGFRADFIPRSLGNAATPNTFSIDDEGEST